MTDASIVLFADKTTLIFQDGNYDNQILKCKSVLPNFQEWTFANRISLNADKTLSMFFTNRRVVTRRNLYFGTELIRKQEECVLLGVKIVTRLMFVSILDPYIKKSLNLKDFYSSSARIFLSIS